MPVSNQELDLELSQLQVFGSNGVNKGASLATRPSPVYEQLLLSFCSLTQPRST